MKKSLASVLVIEPHPFMREALCNAIALEPALTLVDANPASAGMLALHTAHEILFLPHNVDIIILALGNPGQDDLRALQSLRRQFPHALILTLTSDEVPGQERAALALGANASLGKAASRAKMLDVLRELRKKIENPLADEPRSQEVNRTE